MAKIQKRTWLGRGPTGHTSTVSTSCSQRADSPTTKSKRKGWGTITRQSGDIQVYDKDGNRIGSGILPAPAVKR